MGDKLWEIFVCVAMSFCLSRLLFCVLSFVVCLFWLLLTWELGFFSIQMILYWESFFLSLFILELEYEKNFQSKLLLLVNILLFDKYT